MRVEPYLYFNGRCEEAIEFYRRAIDAEIIVLSRYANNPDSGEPPGTENRVMHCNLRIGDTNVLASDGQASEGPHFQGFSLSLTVSDDAEVERLFEALSDGGNVQVPLMSTPFASRFAMVTDRFGVLWTIAAQNRGV